MPIVNLAGAGGGNPAPTADTATLALADAFSGVVTWTAPGGLICAVELSLSGADAAQFSLSPTQVAAGTDPGTVTVTRSGVGAYSAQIDAVASDGSVPDPVAITTTALTLWRTVAQAQGWDYIWSMDTAGTSQPNLGDGAAVALTLTQSRATTAQTGAEGQVTLNTPASDHAVAASAINLGTGPASMVLFLNITGSDSTRAIFSGGAYSATNANGNLGYVYGYTGQPILYQKPDLATVCTMHATFSTGVWMFGITVNAAGAATTYARKVGGGAKTTATGTRGVLVSNAQTPRVGGDHSTYQTINNVLYGFAVSSHTMTEADFDNLCSVSGF